MNHKLSPSDLTFLYNGCKRCFYLKKVHNIAQPSMPFPSIFSKIAGLLKTHYDGKRTEELHPGLPAGTVKYGEKWVESQNIQISGHNDTCFIKGRFDVVVEFDDGTFGVIDYKTGNPENEYNDLYSRQLHAYAYSLENPAYGSLQLSPVSRLGLLYFYPTEVSQDNIDWLSYDAKIELIEMEKNDQNFLSLLGEVLTLLESPKYPESAPKCSCCKYIREIGRIDNG
jgi:hypothetical protein